MQCEKQWGFFPAECQKLLLAPKQNGSFITAVGNNCPSEADVWSKMGICLCIYECVCVCWHDMVWEWTLFDQFKPAGAAEADFGTTTAEKQRKSLVDCSELAAMYG